MRIEPVLCFSTGKAESFAWVIDPPELAVLCWIMSGLFVVGTISSMKSNKVISDIQKTKAICRFIIVLISLLLIEKKILDKLEELLSRRFFFLKFRH